VIILPIISFRSKNNLDRICKFDAGGFVFYKISGLEETIAKKINERSN
jgi:hypothetical protein